MNPFRTGRASESGHVQNGDPQVILAKLDTALTSIFNNDGKATVLYYLSSKYGLTLEQASTDPGRLEKALTGMLGEVGWTVVKKAILESFWERKIEMSDTKLIERVSLRDVFGIPRGLGLSTLMLPR